MSVEGGSGDPPEDHRASSPAFDPSRDVTYAVEVLDRVCRRQRPLERFRQVHAFDGERLVEPFAKRRGGTRVFGREHLPWRRKYAGMNVAEAKRLKQLELSYRGIWWR